MKASGMRSILGSTLMALIAGQDAMQALKTNRDVIPNGHFSPAGSFGKPWYFTTNPNRKRKVNKNRLSHNAKLKRRKAR